VKHVERAIEQLFHIIDGPIGGFVEGRGDVRHDEGLVPGGSGFEEAALVVAVRFITVVIAGMNFGTGNPLAKSAERCVDG
jgi:hypothetical protein